MVRKTLSTDALDRLSRAVARRFEVDRRALAAFRIAVGALVLADLALRSRDLVAFYTDDGVFPRELLFAMYGNAPSLHAMSGEAWFQALLFVLAGGFALAMTVGYRTRTATVVSFLLLVSLHLRNPAVLNGGDGLLRVLLLWGIFLPLGERWALDARETDSESDPETDRERTSVVSVGTVALLSQVVLMYATNAVHKTRSDAWMSGEAVVYIFGADQFTVLLGNVLGEYRALLELVTLLWVALLLAAPLLLALTGAARATLASAFLGAHLGMAVTLQIDLFPLIAVAGLLPFYPPVVWDAVESLASRTGLADALRRGRDRVARTATAVTRPVVRPAVSALPARSRPAIPIPAGLRHGVRTGCILILPCVLFALVLTASAVAVDYAEVPEPADEALDVADQDWRMFAPNPTKTTRWFAAPGALANGTTVDVLPGSGTGLDRPPSVEDAYPNSRWRKYLSNVRWASDETPRPYLGDYLCDRWNATHETGVESVTVYVAYERTDPYDGTTEAGETKLHEHECSGEVVRNDD